MLISLYEADEYEKIWNLSYDYLYSINGEESVVQWRDYWEKVDIMELRVTWLAEAVTYFFYFAKCSTGIYIRRIY